MRRLALVLVVPLLLVAACSDDAGGDDDAATDGGQGTVAVHLAPTEGIFVEGFEVGLRFTDAASGEELHRQVWSDFVRTLDPSDPQAYYDAVYEQPVAAGVLRIGADVNIGIGPGPEPPDLDAPSMPCELDVEVADGETVEVEVGFDDSTADCLKVV